MKDNFGQIRNYLWMLYGANKAAEHAAGFGRRREWPDGLQIALGLPPQATDVPAAGTGAVGERTDVTAIPASGAGCVSKVVDTDDGKPLVVYHGTAGGFEAFDAGKASTEPQGRQGDSSALHEIAASGPTELARLAGLVGTATVVINSDKGCRTSRRKKYCLGNAFIQLPCWGDSKKGLLHK